MTSSGFNATTDTMQKAAGQVRDVKDAITQELKTLEGAVEGVKAYWQGAGATSFNALMQKWNDDSTSLQKALNDIADQIGTSSDKYHAQDQQSEQALQKIVGQLHM